MSHIRTASDRRRKASGGQALVLVTLGLFAMAGMMGLGVDMGWSFFVQKQAQAAADGAALGAVQEAWTRLSGAAGGVSGFTCAGGSQGTAIDKVDCKTSAILCSAVVSTSNLNNGCKYAVKNGFDWTVGRTNVRIQSNAIVVGDATTLPVAPDGSSLGLHDVSYWVTVRTVRVIPQMFTAIGGSQQGTVAAIATAGLAAVTKPGSFFGMNRHGDCLYDSGGAFNCGVDVQEDGKGNGIGSCPGGNSPNLCAPAGIILASSCAAASGNNCSQNYGAESAGGAWGSSLNMMSTGNVSGNWTPSTPTYSTSASLFQDVYHGTPQPPIMTDGSTIGTCRIPHAGAATSVSISGNIGPYLYYGYNTTTLSADGVPIKISGTATFSASASCPVGATQTGGPGNQTNSQFPTYMFYGGLQNNGTMNLGPGQYVVAGVKSSITTLVYSGSGTVRPDPAQPAAVSTGTMFISTDSSYPGLNIPFSPLSQGSVELKNADITMYGVTSGADPSGTSHLPDALNAYSGIMWWQDRRNSTVGYNKPSGSAGCVNGGDCTGDNGDVIYCAGVGDCGHASDANLTTMETANHVDLNDSSPRMYMEPGNANLNLNGVIYQPRGAWMQFHHGNTGLGCGPGNNAPCPLQVVTGSLIMDNGDTSLILSGPTNPIITYKPTLLQ